METRKEIEDSYNIRDGRIIDFGKFEGEAIYVPYFWGVYMDGCADSDDGEVLTFDVTDDDRREFPELVGVTTVALRVTDSGFVCEV